MEFRNIVNILTPEEKMELIDRRKEELSKKILHCTTEADLIEIESLLKSLKVLIVNLFWLQDFDGAPSKTNNSIGSDQTNLSNVYALQDLLKRLSLEALPLAMDEVNEGDRARLRDFQAEVDRLLEELPED